MNKLAAGLILGIAAGAWVVAFDWAQDHHVQALMIFISIVSAVQGVSRRERSSDSEANRA